MEKRPPAVGFRNRRRYRNRGKKNPPGGCNHPDGTIESKNMLDGKMGHSEPQNRSTIPSEVKITLCERAQKIPAPLKGKATGLGFTLQDKIRKYAPKLKCADGDVAENSIILRNLEDKKAVQQVHACIGSIKRSKNIWLNARSKKNEAGKIDMMVFRVRAPRGSGGASVKPSNENWSDTLSN